MSYRDTASFGKRQEYVVIAELLKRGFDVYQPLVDDQQIDCIIRKDTGKAPVYAEIQIKARSEQAQTRSWGQWSNLKVPNPRPSFFFVFYSQPLEGSYWIVPSQYLVENAAVTRTGKYKGLYSVTLGTFRRRTETIIYKKEFEKYRNNFEIL